MKRCKTICVIVMFLSVLMSSSSLAYTINIDDVKAKDGEDFCVKVNVDENTRLASGRIKYDSSKVEYVGKNQEYLECNVDVEGGLSWVYVDAFGEGTTYFEFEFKSKSNKESDLCFEDIEFIGKDGTEYNSSNISGNTSIKINKKNYTLVYLPVVLMVTVVIIKIVRTKRKK